MNRAGMVLLALLPALACCEEADREALRAPPNPRATVVIDPPRLGVGQVAVVEVAVVTPARHRVLPLTLPTAVPGLWLLDAETLPPEQAGERWIHRTRIRVRPQEAGSLVWPELRVEVEGAEGERKLLATEARPLQVGSALERLPDRVAPFPLRPAPRLAGWSELVVAFALGALCALGSLAGWAWVRRRRRSAPQPSPPGSRGLPPWETALERIRGARLESPADLRLEAGRVAAALRLYLHQRFGMTARVRTTEELAALRPPFFLVSRWATLLAILRTLDEVRFRPDAFGSRAASAAERMREALASAERFVTETLPLEARR